MTATERVRELLDERGVEWSASDTYRLLVTSWSDASGHSWSFMEHRDGSFSKLTAYHLTPEQAIAATLGREPDEAAIAKLHDRMNVALLECKRTLGIEKADGTIVVPLVYEMHNLLEEAAALGSCSCTNSERTEACLPHFWTHDGTLHIELPKLPESISVRLPAQRDREVGSARVWQYTRDSGTCHECADMDKEIVRCRDCKHYSEHEWIIATDVSDVCHFFGDGVKVEPDGFCAWGDRKEVDA